jgi:hypothetical protein
MSLTFHTGWVSSSQSSQIYAETRDALQAEGKDTNHEVYVLTGGFGEFQAKFKVGNRA